MGNTTRLCPLYDPETDECGGMPKPTPPDYEPDLCSQMGMEKTAPREGVFETCDIRIYYFSLSQRDQQILRESGRVAALGWLRDFASRKKSDGGTTEKLLGG